MKIIATFFHFTRKTSLKHDCAACCGQLVCVPYEIAAAALQYGLSQIDAKLNCGASGGALLDLQNWSV